MHPQDGTRSSNVCTATTSGMSGCNTVPLHRVSPDIYGYADVSAIYPATTRWIADLLTLSVSPKWMKSTGGFTSYWRTLLEHIAGRTTQSGGDLHRTGQRVPDL